VLGRRVVAAAVLALCLLVPATASAAEEDEGAIAAFQLKASNGYRVFVLASRPPGKAKGRMVMFVGKRGGTVIYGTSATVEETGIRADLGELGRIDLEYVPLKGKEKYSCGSEGEVSYLRRGEYRGIFDLHGEEGYTEARTTRLSADESLLFDLVCGEIVVSFGDSTGPGLPGARLNAALRQGGDSALTFEIKKNRPAAPAAFSVSVRERRGKVQIKREIDGLVGAGGFRYDPRLRTATVSPPAPFDGSATFRREAPRRNRWTGDLTVDLPGRSDTPLIDPGFRTSLVHARWTKSREGSSQRPALGRPLALLEAP
jgi:hypothetical protein